MKIKVAVGYARRSSNTNPKSSIPNQIIMIEEYCEEHNIVLKDVYIDDAKSGTKVEGREQYILLKENLRTQQTIDLVIIAFADRLGREAFELIRTVEEIRKSHVELICVYEGLSSKTASTMQLVMLAIQAELENNQRVKRVSHAKLQLIQQGKYVIGPIPYGYKVDDNKHLVIDKANGDVVKQIFKKYSEGIPIKKITKSLEPTKTLKRWTASRVKEILTNKTYTGHIYSRKNKKQYEYMQLSKKSHPALVSETVFNDCINALKIIEEVPGIKPRIHLLTRGIFLCPLCKSKVVTITQKDGKEEYFCIKKCWRMVETQLDNMVINFLLEDENRQTNKGGDYHYNENLSLKKELEESLASGLLDTEDFSKKMMQISEKILNTKSHESDIKKIRYSHLIRNENYETLKKVLLSERIQLSLDSSIGIYLYTERKDN